MADIIPLKRNPRLYEAKRFNAGTALGEFAASGTLCGHIDFIGPFKGTYCLSPDEVLGLITMLQQARIDVLSNSYPVDDPRLYDAICKEPEA